MHRSVTEKYQSIDALCRRYDVRRLEVFGSAARGEDFFEAASDIDFLVQFDPGSRLPPLEGYFGLRTELSELFGRPVDLVEVGAITNPFMLADIESCREVVYAA